MKLSQYPADSSPTTADYLLGNKAVGPSTQNFTLLSLVTLFWTLANIPSGGTSPITRDSEAAFDYVASGLIISADSVGVNKNYSFTSGVVYIKGIRIAIASVSAQTVAASKDRYIDILSNGDGTGTVVNTEVTNNAASPALAASSIRIGIVVAGATTIAAVGSLNQGQETMVLPIASSIPYAVTDSLGNLICPRDPTRRRLGYRQITSNVTATTQAQLTGLSCPVIVPTGRSVKITVILPDSRNSTVGQDVTAAIWDGAVGGTRLTYKLGTPGVANGAIDACPVIETSPSSASKTYNVSGASSSGTATFAATATSPAYILVELA